MPDPVVVAVKANVPTPEPQPPYWWISYCDATKPEGEQFLGAVIVRGVCMHDAADNAGKIEGVPTEGCPRGCCCHHHIELAFSEVYADQEWRVEDRANRWITREEVMAEPYETMGEVEERVRRDGE